MARRVRDFGRSHEDAGPSYTAARTRAEQLLVEADEILARQNDGFVDARNATARKHELRERMTRIHLRHLATVGRQAAAEDPNLERRLALVVENRSFAAFRAVAGRIAADAAAQRELLLRHGLDEQVLDDFARSLDRFDGAVALGHQGRQKHVAATAALRRVASAVVRAVEVMDGVNRFRFADDPETLRAWESASTVVTVTPAPEEVKPAA
jgi:hypothetical protein